MSTVQILVVQKSCPSTEVLDNLFRVIAKFDRGVIDRGVVDRAAPCIPISRLAV